jgi:hypothetical protein
MCGRGSGLLAAFVQVLVFTDAAEFGARQGLATALPDAAASPQQLPALSYNSTRWSTGWNARCLESYTCMNDIIPDRVCGPSPCQRLQISRFYAGADPRRQPIISWSVETRRLFQTLWRSLQFPAECTASNSVLIDAFNWGLLSQLRDFTDQLLAGLYLRRTMVLDLSTYEKFANNQESAFLGCDRPYLECFFAPFSSCGYDALFRNKTNESTPRWPFVAWVIPNTGQFEADWLWEKLAKDSHIKLSLGGKKERTGPDMFNGYPKYVVSSLKTSMIRALLVEAAFQLHPSITTMATKILSTQPFEQPMLAIHVRRTDKTDEDAYFAKFRKFMPLEYYFKIAKMLEDRNQIYFKSIFLLTDDFRVIEEVKSSGLTKTLRHDPVVVSNNLWDEVKSGASSDAAEKLQQDQAFLMGYKHIPKTMKVKYQYSFLAEVFAAAKHSTYVLGSGRSGVGQLISQLIGARYMTDPNAFTVWTEDWLPTIAPETFQPQDFEFEIPQEMYKRKISLKRWGKLQK